MATTESGSQRLALSRISRDDANNRRELEIHEDGGVERIAEELMGKAVENVRDIEELSKEL